MIPEVLNLGDLVVLKVSKGNREWKEYPDNGTQVRVLSFHETYNGRINNFGLKPGVYNNRAYINVFDETFGEFSIRSAELELVDQDEYKRRLTAWNALPYERYGVRDFIRDLPETPIWEGDHVSVRGEEITSLRGRGQYITNSDCFIVSRINYGWLTKSSGGYAAYDLTGGGTRMSVRESDLELVERGLVWKYFHGEPLSFATLRDEAEFFSMLGHTEAVSNPRSGYEDWTLMEGWNAIRTGIAHGFSLPCEKSGSQKPSHHPIRYRDEDLGRRVAEATLNAYGLIP